MTAAQVTDLTIDPQGPEPLTVFQSDGEMRIEADADPLSVEFCAAGVPGRDGSDGASPIDVEAVAAVVLSAGMPVAIDRASGKFIAADAEWKPAAFVAGLLRGGVESGFVGAAATEQLTLADWSAVTGAALLSPGVPYFLGAGVGLTTVAPASGACVTLIGKALNATTMLIAPQPPIEL